MVQSGYADSIVNGMLGWLKGFANWVLKLFDLAGNSNVSPLSWLSDNWLKLVILLLIGGVILDWGIWLIRWRPYWVWFRKKRIVVDDEDFFAGEELVDSGMYDPEIFGHEVADAKLSREVRRPRPGTIVKRAQHPDAQNRPRPETSRQPRTVRAAQETMTRTPVVSRRPQRSHVRRPAPPVPESRDIFEQQDLFDIENNDASPRRIQEDDVFNVANLPGVGRRHAGQKRRPVLIVREEDDADDDLFKTE